MGLCGSDEFHSTGEVVPEDNILHARRGATQCLICIASIFYCFSLVCLWTSTNWDFKGAFRLRYSAPCRCTDPAGLPSLSVPTTKTSVTSSGYACHNPYPDSNHRKGPILQAYPASQTPQENTHACNPRCITGCCTIFSTEYLQKKLKISPNPSL